MKMIEQLCGAIKNNRLSLVHIEKLLSKLKIALESLDDMEENIRIYFSLSTDVMFSFDTKLNVMRVSPNVERILGYKSGELVGRNLNELKIFDPKGRKDAYDDALHILKEGNTSALVYQFITKDGKRKFGEVINTCVMKEGHVAGLISVCKDITERIRK